MPANATCVVVQQALHGYDRGHHLLAASLTLNALATRRLQIATDLSGPAVVRGFEAYFTGFLLDESFYAVARTWYADEMPRPGCVWTHTLLLRVRDVARVRHLAPILQHLRRPTLGESLDRYAHPLSVDVTSTSAEAVLINERARATITALYSTTDRAVVAPSAAAADLDGLVLALWQMHPTWLKRTFSFCTGALSISAADTARDLLVVPDSVARRLRSDATIVVGALSEHSPWLQVVEDHIVRPQMRPHLRFFASDVAYERTSIRKVAEVLAAVRSSNAGIGTVASALQLVAERFPVASEARTLKSALLDSTRRFLTAGPAERLSSLVTPSGVLAAFAPNRKILSRLIKEAYRESPQQLMHIGERLAQAPDTHDVLRGILSAGGASDIGTASTALIVEALSLSARHSRSAELWASVDSRADEILVAAGHEDKRPLPAHRWADVLTGILRSGVLVQDLRPLVNAMPTGMLRDVLARTPLTNASSVTREALLAALIANPGVLWEMVVRAPAGDWIGLAVDVLYVQTTLSTGLLPHLCRLAAENGAAAEGLDAFVVLIGLRGGDADLVPCILAAAARLHRKFADEPTQRLQDLADRELPSIGRHYDWDLCERLCHAIASRFVRGAWHRDLLFAEIHDRALFRSIVRVAAFSKSGRRWLEGVRRAVLVGRIAATEWQRRTVVG